jgi:hypothetical protein
MQALRRWKEDMTKRLFIFFILFLSLAVSPLTASAALLCSQMLAPKNFESLRSEFTQASSPTSRMHSLELETALSRLEQGLPQEGDLSTILSFGDPVSIAATQDWNQTKTESVLRQIVSLLEKPENQQQILSGELLIKNFFKQTFAPWFGLIPKDLLSQLILSGLGGATDPSPSERVLLPHLPELIKTLGVDSPTVHTCAARPKQSLLLFVATT